MAGGMLACRSKPITPVQLRRALAIYVQMSAWVRKVEFMFRLYAPTKVLCDKKCVEKLETARGSRVRQVGPIRVTYGPIPMGDQVFEVSEAK
jgi:hypothetical protein